MVAVASAATEQGVLVQHLLTQSREMNPLVSQAEWSDMSQWMFWALPFWDVFVFCACCLFVLHDIEIHVVSTCAAGAWSSIMMSMDHQHEKWVSCLYLVPLLNMEKLLACLSRG